MQGNCRTNWVSVSEERQILGSSVMIIRVVQAIGHGGFR